MSKTLTEKDWENLDPLIKKLATECWYCGSSLRTENEGCFPEQRNILLNVNKKLKELNERELLDRELINAPDELI